MQPYVISRQISNSNQDHLVAEGFVVKRNDAPITANIVEIKHDGVSGIINAEVTGGGLAFQTGGASRASVSANGLSLLPATTPPAGGTAGLGISISNVSQFGIYFGTGAPTLAAAQGSLYLRRDGSSTITRAYINTDGATTWTPITTSA